MKLTPFQLRVLAELAARSDVTDGYNRGRRGMYATQMARVLWPESQNRDTRGPGARPMNAARALNTLADKGLARRWSAPDTSQAFWAISELGLDVLQDAETK